MKKIKIVGLSFKCEEKAYKMLKEYIADLKEYFSQNKTYDEEVINDILLACEEKLANLLVKRADLVINEEDVQQIISQFGTVETITEGLTEQEEFFEEKMMTLPKILYRNTNKKWIGGVCAGLATYFSIPVWIVRLLTFFLIFTPFPSVIPYLILWYILPSVRTKTDELRMYGKPITINTLTLNNDEYAKKKVVSLLKGAFIVCGIVFWGILALISFVAVLSLFSKNDDAVSYLYECKNHEFVEMLEKPWISEKVWFDSEKIGGEYWYNRTEKSWEWKNDALDIAIYTTENKQNLSVKKQGEVIHEECKMVDYLDMGKEWDVRIDEIFN